MYRFLVTFTLLTFSVLAISQNLIIDEPQYKPGIYRTFREFKFNNPSIEFNYEVTTKERGYGFLNVSGQVTYFRIAINKKEAKSIGEVFGFSDGKNVYINEKYPRLSPKAQFSKIEYFGLYCYFEDIECTTTYTGASPNSYGTSSSSSCRLDEKIININTGEIIQLNKRTMRDLLADDAQLLNEFNDENQKNKKLKEYVIMYVERKK